VRRQAGVLLHPTALPGPYGIGEIGPAARELLAWMDAAELHVWQVLPLGPVDDGGSPYASTSSVAHEPLLLSSDDLVRDGWLKGKEKPYAAERPGKIDWPSVRRTKGRALALAADRVREQIDLVRWESEHPALGTWALYLALAREQRGPWPEWPDDLGSVRDRLATEIERTLALQWLFTQQWSLLRAEAATRGIELWGDVPFFVGWSSADVWSRPDRFRLDATGRPVAVSGVPPDAFSATGQLWGHPLLDLQAHEKEGHAWWIARLRHALDDVHRVRIDHFRGIAQVWEVPAGARDASEGQWIAGPGVSLLESLKKAFPAMPFVAEDLGVITPDVEELRDRYALPGMAVLQFAFGPGTADPEKGDNPYLPHHHRERQVVVTGTHDNDTTFGWYRAAPLDVKHHLRRYLEVEDRDLPWALLVAAWRSVCATAIVPMQDLLGLGSEARLNTPGTASPANWSWRMRPEALTVVLAARIAEQVRLSGRACDDTVVEPRP
jgi:4-alpha-glucanotransferase